MFFRTQTGWSWNVRSCLQDLVLKKKTYSAWPSTTICFHLWKSNNQNSKWASKNTAWSRIRFTPDAFTFCSYSSLSQLSLFAFCLPSRVSWYPVFPYTILQKAPHLEKRVTRSMISYTTMLWYTNVQISFQTHCSWLLAGCITFKI